MSENTVLGSRTHSLSGAGRWRGAIRWLLQRQLARLEVGSLSITLPTGDQLPHLAPRRGPDASLVVRRWRAAWRLFAEGDIGFAKGYVDGDWDTPDLAAVLELAIANEHAAAGSSARPWHRWMRRLRHARRQNTRRGSRRNIAAHYDLGNAFYAHWLDRGMQYSSALFTSHDQSLEEAQEVKLRRVAELLAPRGGDRVLEIGCGWGALAEHLVERHGCSVTGITLSREQLAYAQARLSASADAAQSRLSFQDYRDITDRYDRIVSIEMLEAVGERYWPVYFEKLRQCLDPAGVAVLQVITIAADRYPQYRRQPDYIQQTVFPGGMLPTDEIIRREAARAGFCCEQAERFGLSYARTLANWRERFLSAWPSIKPLGFDERFKRMWEYYMVYCEAGFRAGTVDVALYRLTPVNRAAPSR
jgi:cyclopropane-fatty-acyl-phospholipid synthase